MLGGSGDLQAPGWTLRWRWEGAPWACSGQGCPGQGWASATLPFVSLLFVLDQDSCSPHQTFKGSFSGSYEGMRRDRRLDANHSGDPVRGPH